MEKYGVTNAGFITKDYETITEEIETRLKGLFGRDIDLSPGSPIKLLSDLFAIEISKLWVELKNTYDSGFLDTATGQALNSIAAIVGLERSAGTQATGEVTFFRSDILPSGSVRIIPVGTTVQTTDVYPKSFYTTETAYFRPIINDELVSISEALDVTEFDVANIVGELVSIKDQLDVEYQEGATYSDRTVNTSITIPSGSILSVTYKPLSVTVPVKSVLASVLSNVQENSLTVLPQEIAFVHYVTNEEDIINGTSQELDVSLRERIRIATQALGKATLNALNAVLRDIDGVTNVIVKDIVLDAQTYVFTAESDSTIIDLGDIDINSVQSVTGSVSGEHSVESFWVPKGTIVLEDNYSTGEEVTVEYVEENYSPVRGAGTIKIYVSGGDVDVVVAAIEATRAAGIKSVGYDTDNELAYGSEDYPFSWFYRLDTAYFDVIVTIYFYETAELTPSDIEEVLTKIETDITTYINNLEPEEKLWRNKIIQICMAASTDIENVDITEFSLNGETGATYLASTEIQMPVARVITANEG